MTPPAPSLRLKVVSFDLDGTLIHPAIFNVIADASGFGEPLLVSYRAYVEGRMTLEEAFHHDFKYFIGRDVAEMYRILAVTDRWTPGIAEAVKLLHANGIEAWVTTDQPAFLAGYTRTFGIDEVVCTPAETVNGRVTENVRPAFAKWPNLERRLKERGFHPQEVAHIGNGTNDIPVFNAVGRSVAVNALHPSVTENAQHVIPHLNDARDAVTLLLGS